jgi:integrase
LKAESRRYAITQMNALKTFFRVNGIKGERKLDIENYSLSGFDRIRPEYMPTLEEGVKMTNAASSLRNRAIILFLISSGLRVAALCAILYGEVKEELEKGVECLHLRVHGGMKRIVDF